MRLIAYILAADPAWIERSIASYYDIVERIIISYDQDGLGYTGVPVATEECLRRLRQIDPARKMRMSAGHYARMQHTPMANETHQRVCAIREAANAGAEWVLQIDSDEVLPNPTSFLEVLREAERRGVCGIEWPMRVLFQMLAPGRYLEICGATGEDRFEYPGSIAVRPNVELVEGRRVVGPYLRVVVGGDRSSLQLKQPAEQDQVRYELADGADAIVHNSWAREPKNIRLKLATWSHSNDVRSWLPFYLRWRASPYLWRWIKDFHPLASGLWPALKLCTRLPLSAIEAR